MLLDITRGDITFYLGTIATVIVVFTALWRVTGGAAFKRIRNESVNKLDLANELSELKDFLRENFVSRKEYDGRGELTSTQELKVRKLIEDMVIKPGEKGGLHDLKNRMMELGMRQHLIDKDKEGRRKKSDE